MRGTLEAICLTAAKGGACELRASGRLVAGRGLEGDRYFLGAKGSGPRLPAGAREVTLIEAEALEALGGLPATGARRNLVTRGIDLNALVGRRFRVGAATLRGIMLCEPCTRLEKLTGRKLIRPLRHRGGLRAEVVEGGEVQLGDTVRPA